MATYTRENLIATGYLGIWAGHVLRGALEGNAQLTFTDEEVEELVAAWMTTPQESGSADFRGFRSVVMPVGEEPLEGEVLVRQGDEWVSVDIGSLVPASSPGFRGPWAPTTAYKARELVIAPSSATAKLRGHLVSANADFTSGASFSATNWTLAEHDEAFTGAFAANTDYTAGQVVSYLGQLYSANANFTSAGAFLLSDWTPLSIQTASLVAVTPAGSLTQTDVQSALQGLAVRSDSVESRSLDLAPAPAADVAMAGHKLTGLADPASAQDAATRAYVLATRDALIDAAPGTLDTLNEIAAQIAGDESVAGALATTVAGKVDRSANLSDLASASTARANLGVQRRNLGAYSALTVGSVVLAGELVTNGGTLYERIADGTISGTFTPGNWTVVSGAPLTALGRFTVMPEIKSSTGGVVRMRSAIDGLTHQWDLVHDGISGNFMHGTTGPNTLASRTVTDAATTSGSATITSATAAFYSGNDRPDAGKLVTGPGIPANASIGTVLSATQATLVDYTTGAAVQATATASGVTLQIGAGPNGSGCVFAIGILGGVGILLNNYAEGSGLSAVNLSTVAATSSVINLQQQGSGAALKGVFTSTGSAPLITLQGANAVAGTPTQEWRDQNAAPIAGQVMSDTGLLYWRRTIQTVAPNSSVTPIIRVADEASAATETYLSAKTTTDHGLVMYRWAGSTTLMYASKWTTSSDRLKLQVGNGPQTKGAETFSTLIEARVNATPQLAIFGAAPVSQQSATADIKTALVNFGLLAAAGSATPLNLEGGTLTAGLVNASASVTVDNLVAFRGKETGGTTRNFALMSAGNTMMFGDNSVTNQQGGSQILLAPGGVGKLTIASTGVVMPDGVPLIFNTTTGSKIGTATTQKFAFWNATPIVQPTRAGQLTDSSGGTSGGNTIAAVTDTATAANAVATLAARLNSIEAKLSAAGGGCGITA